MFALTQIGMDYATAALHHGKAFGWSKANKPPNLAELTPAAIWKLVDEIVK